MCNFSHISSAQFVLFIHDQFAYSLKNYHSPEFLLWVDLNLFHKFLRKLSSTSSHHQQITSGIWKNVVWMSLKTLNFLCTFDIRNCLYLRMLSHVTKCVSLEGSDNKHFECKCITTWMVRSWKSTKVICGVVNMAAMFLSYEFSQTIQNNKLWLSCQCNHFDDVYFKMRIK